MADSIRELAEKMGVDPDALQNTVDEYNLFCETGEDTLFYKKAEYLRAIKEPKFYAAKKTLCMSMILGGIKINHMTEVLDESDEAIPGLYAVGIIANSLYPVSYDMHYPGASFGFALNSGRIAGENVCKHIGK